MHLRSIFDGRRIEPLPEAYSRVTNPERFLPLHAAALAVVGRLLTDFDVSERETFELVPGIMREFEVARPPVTLTPATHGAASIAIAFTRFPSLVVRCGRWFSASFPACACDACAATAELEAARFDQMVDDVVKGHFSEELVIPLIGAARLRWRLGDSAAGDGHYGEGGTVLRRDVARVLRAGDSARLEWLPWSTRPRSDPAWGGESSANIWNRP